MHRLVYFSLRALRFATLTVDYSSGEHDNKGWCTYIHEQKKLALCAVLLAATTSIAHLPQTHAASAPGMVQFVINKTTYTNHTGQHTLSAAPFEQQGNTMVPLRAVADSLGASIKWMRQPNPLL